MKKILLLSQLHISILLQLVIYLSFILNFQEIAAQKTDAFSKPGSLKTISYEELRAKIINSKTSKEKTYTQAFISKAKKNNDTLKLAEGYSLMSSILINNSTSIKYADSIIALTKNKTDFKYPGHGYLIKGISLFNVGSYHKALDNYLIAQNYASKNDNTEQLLFIKNVIGKLKNIWGNHQESLRYFNAIFDVLKNNKELNIDNKQLLFLSTIYSISNANIQLKNLDTALFYTKLGISKSLASSDSTHYYNFVSQAGLIAYHKNNLNKALDSLTKSFNNAITLNDRLNDHYYIAKIYQKQQHPTKAFYHFKKADSIYNLTNDVFPEIRDLQEYFVTHYKKQNNQEKHLKYIDRLLYVDSVMVENYKNINNTISKKYDRPNLIKERNKILNNLKNRDKQVSYTIVLLTVLSAFSILLAYHFFKKQLVYKRRFKSLIGKTENKTNANTVQPKKEIPDISKEIVEQVLDELEKFETSKAFLNNKVTLVSLSKTINTNSNYLSKIINFYKKKNFSTYISDLRIDFCINQLKKDKNCRKYSIKAIASEIGFNNAESFSKAFYKKTGLYPSYFIKELEKLK